MGWVYNGLIGDHMELNLKCYHYRYDKLTYIIDDTEMSYNKSKEFDLIRIEISNRTHSLKIIRKTQYESILCFLNIINPLFYFYHLKFFSRWHKGYDESFAGIEVQFQPLNLNDNVDFCARVQQDQLSDQEGNNYYKYFIVLDKPFNAKYIQVRNLKMSQKLIRRFKIVHIFSAALYGIIFNILGAIALFQKDKIYETLLFCLFVTLFSINMIVRTLNLKSLYSD